MSRNSQSPQHGEPIAVIGMACRFPGAPDIPAFWDLLESGQNSVREGDPNSGSGRMAELFPDTAERAQACRFGAFVDDIDQFDAEFFRISPVEAELLDPQQRMMLEMSWLALEDAGIDAATLRGSRTGVYAGISNDEYRMLVVDSSRPTEAAGCLYALSGTNLNGASGRVSFVLGLMGPAKAVDAACASSLVSVHDAVADLQQSKADLAIAGGVQAILNGRIYELRADSMMLSPDGQCKAFDASANGYVRGEGCGVVVLKRLSEAVRDGDRIWAVIRGSAVNHGGASSGLTVPHVPALEQVIEAALSHAGAGANDVDYLEAHGTGTAVGDPIEIEAVANAYCRERDGDRPLLVGSVKTNIGHLESAAGVAGLIKAVLTVNRGIIPRHLHFENPNPAIEWDRVPLQITDSMIDWPQRDGRPRLAAVNSFGISGTNAHMLVEEYRGPDGVPGPANEPTARRQSRFLPISGKSEGALKDLAGSYLAWLAGQSDDWSDDRLAAQALTDMAWTAGAGRQHFDHRAGVTFGDAESLRAGLRDVIEGAGRAAGVPAKIAFAFTGQGSQWLGMGRDLYDHEPVARAVLNRCEEAFREARGESLLDVMFGRNGSTGDLGDTAWEQPALYALECALTALWDSVGVRPGVVMGHSVGEIAAAWAAGVFSLEDGMRFAAARGTLLSGTDPGNMAAVFAPPPEVAAEVSAYKAAEPGAVLDVSADNGAHQVVSGRAADIDAILARFGARGIRVSRLNTTRAFHSALVEPALDALEASLAEVAIRPPDLTFVSNLTGQAVGPDLSLDGAYWREHARQAVAFAGGVRTMAELGVDLVIEIGPHALLGPMTTLAWPESEPDGRGPPAPAVLASMRRPRRRGSDSGPASGFVDAVARSYELGLEISFAGLFEGEAPRRISLPGYPFQRSRHWIPQAGRRRGAAGLPLLGDRHESARGGVSFEAEIFESEPAWLADHLVFGRVIAPGALYCAMACAAARAEGGDQVFLEEVQLHNALVFPTRAAESGADPEGRRIQLLLDDAEQSPAKSLQIFSKGPEGDWTLHVEGRVLPGGSLPEDGGPADFAGLRSRMSPAGIADYYRAKSATGIDLGPSFRTLTQIWTGPGEALAQIELPEFVSRGGLDAHPLMLDGCFQVVGLARNMDGGPDEPTYLPFGWERFWLNGPLPDRIYCHVRMNEAPGAGEPDADGQPEVLSGELRILDDAGDLIGGFSGYAVKRATRAALLSAVEGASDLLYEVAWRERPLASGLIPADFFPEPSAVAAGSELFADYLTDAGVDPGNRDDLLEDLEQWSRSYALATLEKLGWRRSRGTAVDVEELRRKLNVAPEHKRLFRRMFEMLAQAGVLTEKDGEFLVRIGPDDQLPEKLPRDPAGFADTMAQRYEHGQIEVGLFRRSGAALGDVLRGDADPLTLLFSSGEPTAADLYLKAPVARAANRMLSEAVRALVDRLPDRRRLRVIEVGAGTGSATASVLPELPDGRYDYTYTDISAGFFAEAEARFGDGGGAIQYRPLDIEKDPIEQGFDQHGYDLIIASNVLHATRYLTETLGHCAALLAPSGQLIALENLRGLGWMDLTFGQLDGWWRFADDYRPHHALAGPPVWRRALGDAGFAAVEVLGVDESDKTKPLDKGVIVAQGPARVSEPRGLWVLTGAGHHAGLASQLAERNQTVLVADEGTTAGALPNGDSAGVFGAAVDRTDRESWRTLFAQLPENVPFSGVIHLHALNGHGAGASAAEMFDDVSGSVAVALALVQGLADSDAMPQKGLWFITRGGQVTERERGGELAGATLWGLGKALALETGHLQPRMLDLDPAVADAESGLADEFLYPDTENHIVHRSGRRLAARLVRSGDGGGRLALPEDSSWVLTPDRAGVFDRPEVMSLPTRGLEPREVRVAVDAAGINFWDVFRSLGFIEEGNLGREMCGNVVAVGSEVTAVEVGDRVVGLGFGAFGPEMDTHELLVAAAPPEASSSALATIPSAYVSAELSYQLAGGLAEGERVLIHAGAGGVGLAAISLARAAGAEVFATASAPKQGYLRSIGVRHVFDSRTTDFGEQILEATDGHGVHVVLNSLTSEGFIDASLSCLMQGGRFVELARRDILSEAEMAAVRPDVGYSILELDVLKKTDPAWVGEVLTQIMGRFANGELETIIHSRWPLAEAGAALGFMRAARHLGKIVLTLPPLARGQLRADRTYLVTGGLGGIGCAVADWLADRGAGAIVLNGRRDPDPQVKTVIDGLRAKGIDIGVELADVTDPAAIDSMMARIERDHPPLGGVIHSVGVLSDAAIGNQTWESFDRVLRPKIAGAWHLHRATQHLDLDLFVLFSSRVGVMGNPGQGNHAAANAFLDQLAGHRRALGLPGQSIAWGAWSEIGEAAEQKDRIERRRAALGGRWFTPQQGIRALERLVREDATNSVVMAMDWAVFEDAIEDRPAFLEELLAEAEAPEGEAGMAPTDLLAQLRGAPVVGNDEILATFLQQEVQAVLRLASPPAPDVGFFDLGMDSLMAVELRNRLNRAFAGQYTASNTLVFDYPDITALAGHLAEELGGQDGEGEPTPEPEPEIRRTIDSDRDGIAIVGIGCRFPGAEDPLGFWRQLEAGADLVSEGRTDPYPWDGLYGDPNATESIFRRGAFIEGIDRFDSRFFRISPIEARHMDPRQRLLLETTWLALEDAGIDPGGLRGSRTGVYIGVGGNEYRDVIAAGGAEDSFVGTAGSMAVGRVAFALGLEGPAMGLDMVCASSLVAVHQAVAGLQRGEADLALAGGVNVPLSQGLARFLDDLGMISESGRSSTFDSAADGFVRSDGCGIIALKRLSDAEAAGDRIWGVIRGSAINQNGASAGLTVPNGPAQERVLEEALAQSGFAPADVDYLEAHGAGSALGDPIEIQAASAVYGRGRPDDRPLLLGSVKANIGHLEWAAGIASLIKTVLAMRQGSIPRQIHFENPSENIDWNRLPVRVTASPTPWPDGNGRAPVAAVSAFGMSGTNANVVVTGYESAQSPPTKLDGVRVPVGAAVQVPPAGAGVPASGACAPRNLRLLSLSAKSGAALRGLAERYAEWLDLQDGSKTDPADAAALADMAWTAAVGRSHFDHRAGLVFDDAESLRSQLRAVAVGDVEPDPDPPRRFAFVYPALGSQTITLGRELFQTEPAVRAVLERCDEFIRSERGASLLEVMFDPDQGAASLDDPAWAQPATYALGCALTALWSGVGLLPTAVLGQGPGELAAAQAAGALTLEDGLRIAAARGELMAVFPGAGLAPDSGFESILAGIESAPPSLALIGGASGRAIDSETLLDADYWNRQLRAPVAAAECAAALAGLGIDAVIGLGPGPGLAERISAAWPDSGERADPRVITTLGVPVADRGFPAAVAGVYEAGFDLDLRGLFAGETRRRTSVPGYPFQRRRHWVSFR